MNFNFKIHVNFFEKLRFTRAKILQSGPDLEWNAAPDLDPVWKVKNPTERVAIIHCPYWVQRFISKKGIITCLKKKISYNSLHEKPKPDLHSETFKLNESFLCTFADYRKP